MKKYPLNTRQRTVVEQVKQRWIHDRVYGYVDHEGVKHEPVTQEEAERLWIAENMTAKIEHVTFDPEVIARLGLNSADDPIPAEAIVDYNTVKHLF
jgi:hypothetical protein